MAADPLPPFGAACPRAWRTIPPWPARPIFGWSKAARDLTCQFVLGVIGSLIGGFLGYLLFHKDGQDGFFEPAGIIGSFIGAVIVLLVWIQIGKRHSVRR